MSTTLDDLASDEYYSEMWAEEQYQRTRAEIIEELSAAAPDRDLLKGRIRKAIMSKPDLAIRAGIPAARGVRSLEAGDWSSSLVASCTAIELLTRDVIVWPCIAGVTLVEGVQHHLRDSIMKYRWFSDGVKLAGPTVEYVLDLPLVRLIEPLGNQHWLMLMGMLRDKRNHVVHEGEEASEDEARRAHDLAARLAATGIPLFVHGMGLAQDATGRILELGPEG